MRCPPCDRNKCNQGRGCPARPSVPPPMPLRYLLAYLAMRLDGAGHLGAKQYAAWRVRIAQRAQQEMKEKP